MNYSQEKKVHRPIMEVNRNEEVPPLVTYNDQANPTAYAKQNRNILLQQARNQKLLTQQQHTNPSQQPIINIEPYKVNHNTVPYFLQNMQTNQQAKYNHQSGQDPTFSAVNEYSLVEKRQNQELRQTIKDLNKELNKLRLVNEGLMTRIKEVESSYRNLRADLQRINEDEKRKLKVNIYHDIEQYIKISIQTLALSLKNEKMTPILQDKLERFMAQILEINAISVEQMMKRPKKQMLLLQTSRKTRHSRLQKAQQNYIKELSNSKNTMIIKEQYASIMQRLSGQTRMSKSFAGAGLSSISKKNSQLKNVYATTPQKRRKIFD